MITYRQRWNQIVDRQREQSHPTKGNTQLSQRSRGQEPTESKKPIRTRDLGHVIGYQPIRDQYFLILTMIREKQNCNVNRGSGKSGSDCITQMWPYISAFMLRALRTRLRLRRAFSPRCLSTSTEGVPHSDTPAHENASQFPTEADVVVIGGGSIGNSTLYHLGKLGVNAVLLEKDQLTAGTTWHSAGLVWSLRPSDIDTLVIGHTLDLVKEGGEIEQLTGLDCGFNNNGGLFIANNKERLDEYKRLQTPIRTRYLGHVTGYRRIRDQYFMIRSDPAKYGIENMPNVRDHDLSVYLRLQGNGLSIGGYEPWPDMLPEGVAKDFAFGLYELDWDTFAFNVEHCAIRVPTINETGIKSTVCGPESFTPDHKPLLGETLGCRGFYQGCGFNSSGIMLAGGSGRELANMVLDFG
eukprot:sb/3465203/